MILESKKIEFASVSTFSPSICHEVVGVDAMILVFECWVLSQLFYPPLSPSSRGSLVPLYFLPAIRVVSSAYLRLLVFLPAILIPACAFPVPHSKYLKKVCSWCFTPLWSLCHLTLLLNILHSKKIQVSTSLLIFT